ncbi:MAG: DNA/RNA nuclease SfsA [Shewanella xiamenensis]|uniref:DNA/RNA nuclease SfsA n=1 Tax=Shewanella TaxID=22 RepID=UPI0006DB0BA9|nr:MULTISPECIES: DNA/RNA nuclease SfsA [Shewanella]KPN75963.1 XRE family transcriptional regulator [Shewanella sp. Sh95]MCD8549264.1 DNA/RNA nuclease SfsA [Shewanella xiamenensis]MCD8558576.1 DNA/RNA nuclease SfsA [Shewanella xiamenensis]MCT8858431.1 DNA/RNA nuclease SfsA [Shewanella xiamenensis]MDN5501279.1 DNA/RNA nuclease SfsA [Shewanella sp.]
MHFTPALKSGKLLKRYKRFLADVQLEDGSEITLHCPNTGSMRNCLFPGETVWFSTSNNPKRKYAHTWELMTTPTGGLIGIHSGNANALVEEALNKGIITELKGYDSLSREVKYGDENSRIDILLEAAQKPACYIEVKSCTLLEDGQGYFPDAVSLRGQKHLRELMHMASLGHRAVLLFVVQHTDIMSVAPAAHIDPEYSNLLKKAILSGVEVLAYRCEISPDEIHLAQSCPVRV